ncbi:MAG TPA: KH domain-containing protein [Oceanithermus sp.]|nr:KH domain-containing protein [Oceanithermus sp.]
MEEKKRDLDDLLSGLGIGEEEAPPEAPPAAEPDAPGPAAPKTVEEVVEHFLVGLLLYLDPAYTLEVRTADDRVYVEVLGGDLGRLIGKEGKTLKALEQLVNAVLARHFGHRYRAVVDAAGYRRRRADRAVALALRAAAQVAETGEPVPLPPMTPAERRAVHIALKDHPDVYTESEGEGEGRHVVVFPASGEAPAEDEG